MPGFLSNFIHPRRPPPIFYIKLTTTSRLQESVPVSQSVASLTFTLPTANFRRSSPTQLKYLHRKPSPKQPWQKSIAMAPNTNNNHGSSNRNGEVVGRQANVLASCYVVDASSRLTGFHYSTTGAGGAYTLFLASESLRILTDNHIGAQWFP